MLVRVDMVEREAGGAERLELGADFRRELAPHAGENENRIAGPHHVWRRIAIAADQAGDLAAAAARARRRPARDAARPAAPAAGGRAPRHRPRPAPRPSGWRSTGCRRDAPLDGLVDRRIAPEIVGADDQPLIAGRHPAGGEQAKPAICRPLMGTRAQRSCKSRAASHLPLAQELEELDAFAQPAAHHLAGCGSSRRPARRSCRGGNRSACRRSPATRRFRCGQMRIVQRRDLHPAIVDQLGVGDVEPAVLDRLAIAVRCRDRARRARPGSCAG